jgi:hypothetical protein
MLLRAPDSWPHGLVALLAMLVLAVLDLSGAVAAKEAVLRRSMPLAALGVVLFVVLFWVYASSLRYVELALVTLGWVVVLQVGVVLVDHFRYETAITRGQWVAVVVVLAAQAYLLLGASSEPAPAPPGSEAAPAAVAPAPAGSGSIGSATAPAAPGLVGSAAAAVGSVAARAVRVVVLPRQSGAPVTVGHARGPTHRVGAELSPPASSAGPSVLP